MKNQTCGNCAHWHVSKNGNTVGQCVWDEPIPFWTTIDEGDHEDWTISDQGSTCLTWKSLNNKDI